MTIRVPDAKHARLKELANVRGISFDRLFDEWPNVALAQFDAETRFLLRATHGDAKTGLVLLNKLDKAFAKPRVKRTPPRRRLS